MRMGDDSRLLLETARMYYVEELNKKEIAERLEISQTQVARLLAEAEKKRIVEIKFHPPRLEELEKKIIQSYRCLSEAIVVPTVKETDYEFQRKMWGAAAADYLQKLLDARKRLKENPIVKVGLSGGYTTYELVSALSEDKERNIEIYPTAIIGRGPTIEHFDPLALVTLLWAKSGHKKEQAYYATVPPFKSGINWREIKKINKQLLEDNPKVEMVYDSMKDIEIVFTSIGTLDTPSDYTDSTRQTTLKLLAQIGITKEKLKESGAVGDLSYCYLNIEGKALTDFDVFIALDLKHFRDMSKKYPTKRVVVMAGHYKRNTLEAILAGEFCNILITDEKCADYLVSVAPKYMNT